MITFQLHNNKKRQNDIIFIFYEFYKNYGQWFLKYKIYLIVLLYLSFQRKSLVFKI